MQNINELLTFIENSPSPFHAVETISDRLDNAGFTRLYEQDDWKLEKGKGYYVCRNYSSVLAFRIPETGVQAFNIVASHCDSPTFKIKENPQITTGPYITLNTERYGGMIMSTWMDRPLSVAGRLIVREGNTYTQKLVNIDRDLLVIPNLAIHMDRNMNDGKKFNPQVDMLPLYGLKDDTQGFIAMVAKEAGVKEEDVIGHDLFLYNRQKGTVLGANNEFVCSAKLDDLQCAFASMKGFIAQEDVKAMSVLAVFDNEEVGSSTKQGAASTFLFDTLTRVVKELGGDENTYRKALAHSFMISADNAHAVHPNQPGIADPTNRPAINKGVVIKYNANQRYTTDAISAAVFKGLLNDLEISFQTFANRSDIMGGGTLGNISNTRVALNTVDIGLPQLAMHSAWETAGVKDTEDFIRICTAFYGMKLNKVEDDKYTVG
ncbi:MAG: M18 family aminopeptidase [Oscillospiraceae bacterium]|nr:M18 family aminopeptidase [Oscillospiraceae bacterium]MBQ6851400.1 M18 family aminopeptidase [Oscillospiraceae bacterium]